MELNRTIEQWRGCDPEAMAYHMSEAATMYAFKDAKADILALHAEIARLRDENARLQADAERYRWLKARNSGSIGITTFNTDEALERVLVEGDADTEIDAAMQEGK